MNVRPPQFRAGASVFKQVAQRAISAVDSNLRGDSILGERLASRSPRISGCLKVNSTGYRLTF